MQNDEALKNVTQFSSLSPVPGFRRWILKMIDSDQSSLGKLTYFTGYPKLFSVEIIGAENYSDFREFVASLDPQLLPKFSDSLPKLLFKYLFSERGPDNSSLCPVCNFHVRNGAELWRLNFAANTAHYGMSESLSMMVNYRYYTDKMWQNSYDYQVQKIIPISDSVRSTFLEK
jgi:malonyl-CoA decarboxylase